MKNKKIFHVYTVMWIGAIFILLGLMWQLYGDARIINYSGIVRGGTQKLVKEELVGNADDEMIAYIDGIIYDLQTGEGEYNLVQNEDEVYQEQLDELKDTWESLKELIYSNREDESYYDEVYDLSELHYQQADELVLRAEEQSADKSVRFMVIYFTCLILCMVSFVLINHFTQRTLVEMITKDRLTGILNGFGFEEEAARMLQGNGKVTYVAVEFDIKNFKKMNANYGYAMGDELLCQISNFLKEDAENLFLPARLTADTFVVMGKKKEGMIQLLENLLLEAIDKYEFDNEKMLVDIEFCYGAYEIENNTETVKSILDKVHTAHKMAKEDESDIVWCDEKLFEKLKKEAYYVEYMPQALLNKEFQVYLQPQVDLKIGEVVSAESLVRWKQADGKLLYPDEFIPLFEKNSLIEQLDFYMLEEVCNFLSEQRSMGKEIYKISVNFSRVSLYKSDFYQRFLCIVDSYQIPHGYIEVEVVETALNEMSTEVIKLLTDLGSAGFSVAMDDFGAGYSSLIVLSDMPVHVIKLDRYFLWRIDENDKMKHIIVSTVEMAHSMSLKVICEGVESQKHVDFLKSIDCDYAQGYFYSKPVPKEEYILW